MAKHILIVDDFDYNLKFEEKVIGLLTKEYNIAFHIDSAMSVAEAKEKIETNTPYDIVITDISLPDGTGVEVAEFAAQKSSDTKVVALTLYPDVCEEHTELFHMLLRKPIMPTTYKQKLEMLLIDN